MVSASQSGSDELGGRGCVWSGGRDWAGAPHGVRRCRPFVSADFSLLVGTRLRGTMTITLRSEHSHRETDSVADSFLSAVIVLGVKMPKGSLLYVSYSQTCRVTLPWATATILKSLTFVTLPG